MFSHFSGHEEGFIIDIALNDGLNIQIDKPPSYGRTASFVSPWSYTNSGLRFFAGFLRCSLHDWKRGNWVLSLRIGQNVNTLWNNPIQVCIAYFNIGLPC